MSRWKVGDVMTADVVSVPETASFREIVDLLETRGMSAVPVVTGDRLVVGVVSEADLLPKMEFAGATEGTHLFEGRRRRVARQKATGELARDLMTDPAVTVYAHTPVVEAARRMDSGGFKRLPVIDGLGRLVGIVARRDLLKVFLRTDPEIRDDVASELRQAFDVGEPRVGVEVVDGCVTLTGELERKSLTRGAARLAARVDGVIEVKNLLTFRYDDVELSVVNIP
jgi:CBS domain-containing protein